MLARSSFRVLTATTGEEAFGLLRTEGGIKLVAAELRLPGDASGAALIGRIRVRYPATRVMLMTDRRDEARLAVAPVLLKPFTAEALIRKIGELLADNRRIAASLATVFEWNGVAKLELETARQALVENVNLSRRKRVERYCARLREPGAPVPTILLAEDDRPLRYAVRRFLEGHGFRVIEGADGAAALAASRQYGGIVDLLLTDAEMPGLSGAELVRAVAAERPQTNILMMTASDVAMPRPAVRKPFKLDDLLAEIIGVLMRCRA
jgi:DNA-binding response OmpR family regulator